MPKSYNPSSPDGLTELNTFLLSSTYLTGYQASMDDLTVYLAFSTAPDAKAYPNVARWYNHVKALIGSVFPGAAAGVTVAGGGGGKGGGKGGGQQQQQQQGGGKKEKAKKEAPPPAPTKTPEEIEAEKKKKEAEKKLKAVIKEGGKKGVEIAGASAMGGLEFFCTTMQEPDGDLELLEIAMNAMNKELDPNDEESKGGSGDVGKMIFSAGKDALSIVAYAPAEQSKVDCIEWTNQVIKDLGVGDLQPGATSKFAKAWCSAAGNFSIKMKDSAMASAFTFLRSKDAFPEDDDDDEDDMCFGDDAFDDFM